VRVPRGDDFELCVSARAELVCAGLDRDHVAAWGVMPSGMRRHPLFIRWL